MGASQRKACGSSQSWGLFGAFGHAFGSRGFKGVFRFIESHRRELGRVEKVCRKRFERAVRFCRGDSGGIRFLFELFQVDLERIDKEQERISKGDAIATLKQRGSVGRKGVLILGTGNPSGVEPIALQGAFDNDGRLHESRFLENPALLVQRVVVREAKGHQVRRWMVARSCVGPCEDFKAGLGWVGLVAFLMGEIGLDHLAHKFARLFSCGQSARVSLYKAYMKNEVCKRNLIAVLERGVLVGRKVFVVEARTVGAPHVGDEVVVAFAQEREV